MSFRRNPQYVALAVFAVGIVLLYLVLRGDYLLGALVLAGIYASVILGIVLLSGLSGQYTLGHAAFFGIGAYASALMSLAGVPVLASCVLATALTTVFAIVIGVPILRLKGYYLALATLAFGLIVLSVLNGWHSFTMGPSGLGGIPKFQVAGLVFKSEDAYYWLVWTIAFFAVWGSINLWRSRLGQALLAVKRDEDGAAAVGINVAWVKLQVFALSAALAGLGGALYAHYITFIAPERFNMVASFELLLAALLGGIGTPFGAVFGALLLVALPEIVVLLRDYKVIVYGLVFILVSLYLPRGLAGLISFPIAARPPKLAAAEPESIAAITPTCTRDVSSPMLEVLNVGKSFAGLVALNNISFAVETGSIHGVIGPNGAGKTTLFNVVTSVFPPSSGEVRFKGARISGIPAHRVARLGVARTFQNVRLFGDQTVLENVVIGAYRYTHAGLVTGALRLPSAVAEEVSIRSEAMEYLRFVGLAADAHRKAEILPFGQQRLLEFARALALRPKLLLLDEPAAGLNDSETEQLAKLISLLPGRGITVLLIEHNMGLIMSVADRIVVLNYGTKIAEGDPDEIQDNQEVVSAYLGAPADA
jgi:branched-chain amino acid transport system ATP-binding protein/branched-chain amino acid transport system permease protein